MSGRYGTSSGRRQRGNQRGCASTTRRGVNKNSKMCVASVPPFSPSLNPSIGTLQLHWSPNGGIETSKRRTRDQWETTNQDIPRTHTRTYPTSETSGRVRPFTPSNFTTLPVTPDRQHYLDWRVNLDTSFDMKVSAAPESLAVITQSSSDDSEMETEMDEDDSVKMFHSSPHHSISGIHHIKRSRTDQYTFSLKSTAESATEKSDRSVQTCWWKKNQKHTRTSRNDANTAKSSLCLCHVCNNATSTSCTASSLKQPSKPNAQKQSNSLLSYFHRHPNPTKPPSCQSPSGPNSYPITISSAFNSSNTAAAALIPSQTLQSCAYCDRPACSSCTRACEGGCNLHFCTFCSTINYDGPMERVFCFNCHEGSGDFDCAMGDTSR